MVFLFFSQSAFPLAGAFSQLHCGAISNATRDTVYEDANETARMIDRHLTGGSVQFRGVTLNATTVFANRTRLSAADFNMAMLMFRQGYSVRIHPNTGRVLPEVMNSLSSEYAGLLNSIFQGVAESYQAAGRTPPASITRGLAQLRQDCGDLSTQAAPVYTPGEVQSGVLQPMIREQSADGVSETARAFCPGETTARLSGEILVEALRVRMQDYSCFYIEKHNEMMAAYEAARASGQLRNITNTFSRSVGGGPYRSVTETAPETVNQWKNRIAAAGGPTYSADELFVGATPGMRTPARNVDYAMTSALIGSLIGIPNYRFTLDDDRNSCYAGFLASTRSTLERQRSCRDFQSSPEHLDFLARNARCLAELKNRFCRRQPSRCIGDSDTTVDETVEEREARRRERAERERRETTEQRPVPPPTPPPAPTPQVQPPAPQSQFPSEATVNWAGSPSVEGPQSPVRSLGSMFYPQVDTGVTIAFGNVEQELRPLGYRKISSTSCFLRRRSTGRGPGPLSTECPEVDRPANAPRNSIMVFKRGACDRNSDYNAETAGDNMVLVRSTGAANPQLPTTSAGRPSYVLCGVWAQPSIANASGFQNSVSLSNEGDNGILNANRGLALRWELDAQVRYVAANRSQFTARERTAHFCRMLAGYRAMPGVDNANDQIFAEAFGRVGLNPTISGTEGMSEGDLRRARIRSLCPSAQF